MLAGMAGHGLARGVACAPPTLPARPVSAYLDGSCRQQHRGPFGKRRSQDITAHQTGTRVQWLAARLELLEAEGVLAGPTDARHVRFVTHLDIDDAGIDTALAA